MTDNEYRKQAEKAEYRAKLMEAELNAVKSSRAYQLSKKIGIIKAQIKSDPVGLSKKAAKLILTNPKKARHILRSANRGASILQGAADQTAKYQEWILLNEPDETELDTQRTLADELTYRPLISIITPVFNPPVKVLEELIESVLEQTYANFELCLGNFGNEPEVEYLLSRYAKIDSRVKHYTFSENEGIAGNSNQILKKATGEFIALLDHDDTLSPDALYENVKLLNEKPYDFIYSDKDKIDEKGNRFDPLFKPQLSPEMLLNINYLTHLNVMRTSLVRQIGGWDPETDGAQDWDLFLRVVGEAKHIGFIPRILYHWRVIATSTAMSIETKPYALANQQKTIDKYLQKKAIQAHPYMDRTELFLRWDKAAMDYSPVLFLYFSNIANTQRIVRRARKVLDDPTFVLLVTGDNAAMTESISAKTGLPTLSYEAATIISTVVDYLATANLKSKHAVFMLDTIRLPKSDDWYEKLAGWLVIPEVGAASGRLVNKRDMIINSGGIIGADNLYHPIFCQYPRYYQSYIGNAEWIRDLSILSAVFCITEIAELRSYAKKNKYPAFDDYFLWLSEHRRLVMSPHATAMVFTDDGVDTARPVRSLNTKKNFADPFANPNMAPSDPMRLFENEDLVGLPASQVPTAVDAYQHDAVILADTFDISQSELAASAIQADAKKTINPNSVAWLLPSFDAIYAGLVNIFSFADYLHSNKKLSTTIYVLRADGDIAAERHAVIAMFPDLESATFVAIRPDEVYKIKQHDIGIATQWATAFPLAKTTIAHKCYFIQDNEVNFYPKGSISALVELSYRFGFTAIAGTEGLLDMYQTNYGGNGVVLKSKVDLQAYHPRKDVYYTPKKPYKVFFYARPNMPRNAFELGVAGLKRLKQELGDDVEIITAGAPWDAQAYGVEGMFTNLGKIAYEAVPKLYRSIDAGLMFMFSGHPGVTASELMASGCPTVVNEYADVTWQQLYVNEKTCLTTIATASEVARNLKRCLTEPATRKKLIDGGLIVSKEFYEDYQGSQENAFQYLVGGKSNV